MINAAVVLSGCGFMDGSEINEAVLTLLSLSLGNVNYQCFAPNIEQYHVTNHLTGEQTQESRNVLIESARIARGDINDIATANAVEFDALFFPGGFGAACNLSDFIAAGENLHINTDVLHFAKQFIASKKPIGLICIAPILATKFCSNAKITIGNDPTLAQAITNTGSQHEISDALDIVIDKKNLLVSTPAFMLSSNLTVVFTGIKACVDKVIQLARQ